MNIPYMDPFGICLYTNCECMLKKRPMYVVFAFHLDSLHKVCMVLHITMSVCTCQTPKRDFCWVCFLPLLADWRRALIQSLRTMPGAIYIN